MKLEFQVLRLMADAILPTRAHKLDAGVDLYAVEDCTILPGQTVVINTGVSGQFVYVNDAGMKLADKDIDVHYRQPGGWTLQGKIEDKSGRASSGWKTGGGVIDDGYTGPIMVTISNLPTFTLWQAVIGLLASVKLLPRPEMARMLTETFKPIEIKKGDKIAQLIAERIELALVVEVDALDNTVSSRQANGLGSDHADPGAEG